MEVNSKKPMPKLLFTIALPMFILGMIVSFSPAGWFASEWTVALPLGVILLGMCMIAWRLQDEVARFDSEQRLKNASADDAHSTVTEKNGNPAMDSPGSIEAGTSPAGWIGHPRHAR
jgi:hypothetical protein